MLDEPFAQLIRTLLYNKLSFDLNADEVSTLNSLPLQQTTHLLQKEFYDARDAHIAWRAFHAINSISSLNKVEFIMALLRYSSPEWRTVYCKALAQFNEREALRILCDIYIKDHDTNLRHEAADLLASVGDEFVIDIIEIEQFTDDRFDEFPIASITKCIIQQIHERLASGVSLENQQKRHSSVLMWDSQELLERWMKETEHVTALHLFEAILQVDKFDKVKLLANLLHKSTVGWRIAYIKELSNYQEQRVVDFLSTLLLNDPDPEIRYIASEALGRIGNVSGLAALTYTVTHDTGTDYEGHPIATMAAEAIEMILTRSVD